MDEETPEITDYSGGADRNCGRRAGCRFPHEGNGRDETAGSETKYVTVIENGFDTFRQRYRND